jgi:thiol-disulfide isomerase/thioredoxin
MAPTLYQVEESYRDQVNFVMVNGDDPHNWRMIERLGVDAIPHLALLEADGTVDTALIGPVPKEWLTKDLDVLIENAKIDWTDQNTDNDDDINNGNVTPNNCQPTSTTLKATITTTTATAFPELSPWSMSSTTTNLCAISNVGCICQSSLPGPKNYCQFTSRRPKQIIGFFK